MRPMNQIMLNKTEKKGSDDQRAYIESSFTNVKRFPFSHVKMHKLESVIEFSKIQVAREMQLLCPHNASDRSRTGIFTFSRTKGDLIIWPAIISRHFRHRKGEKPWYNYNSSWNFHFLVQIAKSNLNNFTALSPHTTDQPDRLIAH